MGNSVIPLPIIDKKEITVINIEEYNNQTIEGLNEIKNLVLDLAVKGRVFNYQTQTPESPTEGMAWFIIQS